MINDIGHSGVRVRVEVPFSLKLDDQMVEIGFRLLFGVKGLAPLVPRIWATPVYGVFALND
jgi:hypothetical protein